MTYRLLICAGCKRRAVRCVCTHEFAPGGAVHWPLRDRAIEVEAMVPEDAQAARDALLRYLTERGFEQAAQALAVRSEGKRAIDRLLTGEPIQPQDGRARSRANASERIRTIA